MRAPNASEIQSFVYLSFSMVVVGIFFFVCMGGAFWIATKSVPVSKKCQQIGEVMFEIPSECYGK